MARRSLAALSLGIVAATSGCGHHHSGQPSPAELAAVKPSQWKAVIQDSYDGHIDQPHTCAAVILAIEHLPEGLTTCNVCTELQTYEKKIC